MDFKDTFLYWLASSYDRVGIDGVPRHRDLKRLLKIISEKNISDNDKKFSALKGENLKEVIDKFKEVLKSNIREGNLERKGINVESVKDFIDGFHIDEKNTTLNDIIKKYYDELGIEFELGESVFRDYTIEQIRSYFESISKHVLNPYMVQKFKARKDNEPAHSNVKVRITNDGNYLVKDRTMWLETKKSEFESKYGSVDYDSNNTQQIRMFPDILACKKMSSHFTQKLRISVDASGNVTQSEPTLEHEPTVLSPNELQNMSVTEYGEEVLRDRGTLDYMSEVGEDGCEPVIIDTDPDGYVAIQKLKVKEGFWGENSRYMVVYGKKDGKTDLSQAHIRTATLFGNIDFDLLHQNGNERDEYAGYLGKVFSHSNIGNYVTGMGGYFGTHNSERNGGFREKEADADARRRAVRKVKGHQFTIEDNGDSLKDSDGNIRLFQYLIEGENGEKIGLNVTGMPGSNRRGNEVEFSQYSVTMKNSSGNWIEKKFRGNICEAMLEPKSFGGPYSAKPKYTDKTKKYMSQLYELFSERCENNNLDRPLFVEPYDDGKFILHDYGFNTEFKSNHNGNIVERKKYDVVVRDVFLNRDGHDETFEERVEQEFFYAEQNFLIAKRKYEHESSFSSRVLGKLTKGRFGSKKPEQPPEKTDIIKEEYENMIGNIDR